MCMGIKVYLEWFSVREQNILNILYQIKHYFHAQYNAHLLVLNNFCFSNFFCLSVMNLSLYF